MWFFLCQKPLDWYPGGKAKQVLGSALNLSVEKCYADGSVLVLQMESLSLLFPPPHPVFTHYNCPSPCIPLATSADHLQTPNGSCFGVELLEPRFQPLASSSQPSQVAPALSGNLPGLYTLGSLQGWGVLVSAVALDFLMFKLTVWGWIST